MGATALALYHAREWSPRGVGACVGWNLRTREFGHGAMHQFTGSYIPFPDTNTEAVMTGDPRASVLARYRSARGYMDAIEAAARRLVDERLMLEEDAAPSAYNSLNSLDVIERTNQTLPTTPGIPPSGCTSCPMPSPTSDLSATIPPAEPLQPATSA